MDGHLATIHCNVTVSRPNFLRRTEIALHKEYRIFVKCHASGEITLCGLAPLFDKAYSRMSVYRWLQRVLSKV
jgi:hypothetical protein